MKNISTVFQNLVQLLVALPQGHQHPAVGGPELLGLFEVVEAVVVHLEDLVRLTQSIPGPVVPPVDLNRLPGNINCGGPESY